MVLLTNLFGGNKNTTINVDISDLASSVDLFIQDAMLDPKENKSVALAFDNVKNLLENAFQFEPDKGQLYYALYNSLDKICDALDKLTDDQEAVSLKEYDLRTFFTSYIQLKEAALEYGGSPDIHPFLREAFNHDGHGHAPENEKYKAQLLRDMADTKLPAFFEKYPVSEISHEELEFFDAPSVPVLSPQNKAQPPKMH